MAHAESPSLISLGLATDISPEKSSFRWGLATSCLLHALIIVLAVSLRFQTPTEEPFRTIDVALISSPEARTSEPAQEKSSRPTSTPPQAQPTPLKAQPAPSKPEPTPLPMKEVLPPLPTQTAAERLSDFFGGAIRSIVVPDQPEMASPVMPTPLPDPTLPQNESPLVENLRLPSTAPQLSRPERLHPVQPLNIPEEKPTPPRQTARAQSAPPQPKQPEPTSPSHQSAKIERGVNQAPALPELSQATPFHKLEQQRSDEFSSAANMEESLKRSLPTVPSPLPTPPIQRKATSTPLKPKKSFVPEMSAPQLAQIQPSPPQEKVSQTVKPPAQPVKPPPRRVKPLSKRGQSLLPPIQPATPQVKQASPRVGVAPPQAKQVPPQMEQIPPREKMSKMMEQLLGEVQVPTFKPQQPTPVSQQPESSFSPPPKPIHPEIDQRIASLSIPTVASPKSIKHRLQLLEVKSTSKSGNSSSQTSPGKNRYLAMVEDKIDQQWVAPPLVASTPVVVLKFRIHRSGEISQIRIDESSGNGHYDSAAQRAVQAVNPLPPFPQEISDSYFDVRYRFIKKEND